MEVESSVDVKLTPTNSFACICWKKRKDIGDSNPDSVEKARIENKSMDHVGDLQRHIEDERCKIINKLAKSEDKNAIKTTNSTKHMFRQLFVIRKFQKKSISKHTCDSDESTTTSNMFGVGSDIRQNSIKIPRDSTTRKKIKLWTKRTDSSLNVNDFQRQIKKKKGIFSFFKKSKHRESTRDIQDEANALCNTPLDHPEKQSNTKQLDNDIKNWVRKFKSYGPESYQNVHVRWCNNSYLKRCNTLDSTQNIDKDRINHDLECKCRITMKPLNRASFSAIENHVFGSVKAFTVQTITESPLKQTVTSYDESNKDISICDSQFSEEKEFNVVEYETVKSKSDESSPPDEEEEISEIMNSIDLENASTSFSYNKRIEVEIKDNVTQCDQVKPRSVDIEIMTDPMVKEVKNSVKTSIDLTEKPKDHALSARRNLTETSHQPDYSSWSLNSNRSFSNKLTSSCNPEIDIVFNNMGVKRNMPQKVAEPKDMTKNLNDMQSVEKLINTTLKKMVITSITSKYSTLVPNMNRKRFEMLNKLQVMHFASRFLSFIKTMVDVDSAYDCPEVCNKKFHRNKHEIEKTKDNETLLFKQHQNLKHRNKFNQNKQKFDKKCNIQRFSVPSDIIVHKDRNHTKTLGYEEAIKQMIPNRHHTKIKHTSTLTFKDSTFVPKKTTRNKENTNDNTTKKIKEILEDIDIFLMTQSNLNLPMLRRKDSVDTLFKNHEMKNNIGLADQTTTNLDRAESQCLVIKSKTAPKATTVQQLKKTTLKQSCIARSIDQSCITTQTSKQFTPKWLKMWKSRAESSQSRCPALGIPIVLSNSSTTFQSRRSKKYNARSQSLIHVYKRYGLPGLLRYFRLMKRQEKKSRPKKTMESDLSLTNLSMSNDSRKSLPTNLDKPLPVLSTRSLISIQGEASNEWNLDLDFIKSALYNNKVNNNTITMFTKVKNCNKTNGRLAKVAYWAEQCRHNPRFHQHIPTKSVGTSVDSADTIGNKENLKIVYLNSKEIMIVGDLMNHLGENNQKDNKICLKIGNKDGKYYVVQRDKNFVEEEVGIDKLIGDPKYTNTTKHKLKSQKPKNVRPSVDIDDHKETTKSRDKNYNNLKIDIKIKDNEDNIEKAKYIAIQTENEYDTESEDSNDDIQIKIQKPHTNNDKTNDLCIKIGQDVNFNNVTENNQNEEPKPLAYNVNYSENDSDNDNKRNIREVGIEMNTIKDSPNKFSKINDDYKNNNICITDLLMESNHSIRNQDQTKDVKTRPNNCNKTSHIKDKVPETNYDDKSAVIYTSEQIGKAKEKYIDVTSKAHKQNLSNYDSKIEDKNNSNVTNGEKSAAKEKKQDVSNEENKCYKSNNSDKQTPQSKINNEKSDPTVNSNKTVQTKERNDETKVRANNLNQTNKENKKKNQIHTIDNAAKDVKEDGEHIIQAAGRNKAVRSRANDSNKSNNDENQKDKLNDVNSFKYVVDDNKNTFMENSKKYNQIKERNKYEKQKSKAYHDDDEKSNNVVNDVKNDVLENNDQINQTKEKSKVIKPRENNDDDKLKAKSCGDDKDTDKSNNKYHFHLIDNNKSVIIENSEHMIQIKSKNDKSREIKCNKCNKCSKYNKCEDNHNPKTNNNNNNGINEDNSEEILSTKEKDNHIRVHKTNNDNRNKDKSPNINNVVKDEKTNDTPKNEQIIPKKDRDKIKTKTNNSNKMNNDDKEKGTSYDKSCNVLNDDKSDVVKQNEQINLTKERNKTVRSGPDNLNKIYSDETQQEVVNDYKCDIIDNSEEMKEKENNVKTRTNYSKTNRKHDENYDYDYDIIKDVIDNNGQRSPLTEKSIVVQNKETENNNNYKTDEYESKFYDEFNSNYVNDATVDNDQTFQINERTKYINTETNNSNRFRDHNDRYRNDCHRNIYNDIDDNLDFIDTIERDDKDIIKYVKHRKNKHHHNKDVNIHNYKLYEQNNEYDVDYENYDVTDNDNEQISSIRERSNHVRKGAHHHNYYGKHRTKYNQEYHDNTDHNRISVRNNNHVKSNDYRKHRTNYSEKNDFNDCKCKDCEKSNDQYSYVDENYYTNRDIRKHDKHKSMYNKNKRYIESNKKSKVFIADDEYFSNDDNTDYYNTYYNNYNDVYNNDDIAYNDNMVDVTDNNNHSKYRVNFYAHHNDEGDENKYVDYYADTYDVEDQRKQIFSIDETANDVYVAHGKKKNKRNKIRRQSGYDDYDNKINMYNEDNLNNNNKNYDVEDIFYPSTYDSKHMIKKREKASDVKINNKNIYHDNHNYKESNSNYCDNSTDNNYINGITKMTEIKETANHIFVADTSKHKKHDKNRTEEIISDDNNYKIKNKYTKNYYGDADYDYEGSQMSIFKLKTHHRERHNHPKQKSGPSIVVANIGKSRKKSDTIAVYSCHNSFNSRRGTSGDRCNKKSNESIKYVVHLGKQKTREFLSTDKGSAVSSDENDDVTSLIHNPETKFYKNTFFGRNNWKNQSEKYSSHVLISDHLISNKFGRKKSTNSSLNKTIRTGTTKAIYSDTMSINYKNIIDEFYPDEAGKHWQQESDQYYTELKDANKENTIHVEIPDLSDSSEEGEKNKIRLLLKFNLFTEAETNTDIANASKDEQTNIDKSSSISDKSSSIFDLPVKDKTNNTVLPIVGIVINDTKLIKTALHKADGKKVLAWAHEKLEELKAEKEKYKRQINMLRTNVKPIVTTVTELDSKLLSSGTNSPHSQTRTHKTTRSRNNSTIQKTYNQTYHSQNYYYNWLNRCKKLTTAQNEYVFLSEHPPEYVDMKEDANKSENVIEKKYDEAADILQSHAAKEAVVQLYAEKVVIGNTEKYISRLPKLDNRAID